MTSKNLFVISYSDTLNKEASQFAKGIDLPFYGSIKATSEHIKSLEDTYFLVYSSERIFLKKGLKKSNPIFCNFLEWSKQSYKSLLLKAFKGIPENSTVIDVTAGLGKDSLVISSLAKKLLLVERIPWVCALLEDGINRFYKEIPDLNKIEVICEDSNKYLDSLKLGPEVIYIDPIFGINTRSKAKKDLQALRDLTNLGNTGKLLNKSLSHATNRVIVKRHKKSSFLEDIKPTFSLEGRIIRYDIYQTESS